MTSSPVLSVKEALCSEDREEWDRAILVEIRSLVKNDTLEVVSKHQRQNIVGSRLVLTNKYKPDGSIERRKARIVAKGYSQKFGIDYHQTFAPVARLESIRLVMAIATRYNLIVHQLDVVTAYLNAQLKEEVIMEIPDRMEVMLKRITMNENEEPTTQARAKKILTALQAGGNACRLNKALYGLKQAGRQWNLRLSQKLSELGLNSTTGDPCLYVAHRNQQILLLLVYVDDILIVSGDLKWITEIKQGLQEDFEIQDLGLAKHCIGFEINQDKGKITLTQQGYIIDLLKQYGMSQCNTIATPAECGSVLTQEEGSTKIEERQYRGLEHCYI